MNLSYMSTYALAECSEKEIEKCRKTKTCSKLFDKYSSDFRFVVIIASFIRPSDNTIIFFVK